MPSISESLITKKLLQTLREFPQFVRKRESAMKENQRIIARMAKGIVQEFKKKKLRMK